MLKMMIVLKSPKKVLKFSCCMSEKLTVYFLCHCRIKGSRLTYLKNLLSLLLHEYLKVEDF